MKCGKCQKGIPENSEFCPYCGNNLKEEIISRSETKTQETKKISETETKDIIKTENISNNPSNSLVCKKCKKELQANFKRCPYCGTKVKEEKAQINRQAMYNNKLIIVLIAIIGILLVVSTVFITLYYSSSSKTSDSSYTPTEYTAQKSSDGYTKYICNTDLKIYHISNKCIAAQNIKNKKVYWVDKDFVPGKSLNIYNISYEPCQICAY